MQFGKKKLRATIQKLNEILKAAKMTDTDFSDEIQNTTRLYRNSYIVEPIEKIIDEMKEIITPEEESTD